MDITTIVGIAAGIAALFFGFIWEGGHAESLVEKTALLIVFGGTFAATAVSFPLSRLKQIPDELRHAFRNTSTNPYEMVDRIVDMAMPVLGKLASLFKTLHHTISIEGHTDNLAIQPGGAFQDNWELSAGRALSVLRYFVDQAKIEPKKFKIAGYWDTRPVVPNTINANKQKNRRVEITVLHHLDLK
ncbi:OmpA family protein [Paenibacillus solisilvae]|uniref:OmpA family protein n=1 Tax=Paenibacillus solisilvae TaxID=2486751 RepID=A0ABW0VYG3_9BACL